MSEHERLDEITTLITEYASTEVWRIFKTLYPTEEIGYVRPVEGSFFTAEEAETVHTLAHEAMDAVAKHGPPFAHECAWTVVRDEIERFIEGLVGEPEDVVDQTLDKDAAYIANCVADYISARRDHILRAIGYETLDTKTLYRAVKAALWGEAHILDQTVPASILTDSDELTMVFEIPRGAARDDVIRKIGSDPTSTDALADPWSTSETSTQILAVKTRMPDLLSELPEGHISTARFRGGGLIGSLRGGDLQAVSLTDAFVVDPYALVPCMDGATRQPAVDWLRTRNCADIVGPVAPTDERLPPPRP